MSSFNVDKRNFEKIKEYEKNGPKKSFTGKHSLKGVSLLAGAGIGAALGSVGLGMGAGIVVGSLLDRFIEAKSEKAEVEEAAGNN